MPHQQSYGIAAGGTFRLADVFGVTPRPAPIGGNGNRQLLFPLIGSAITSSNFGYRLHPILGSWLMHAGRDLAAPEGTPVVAALADRVVSSGLAGGYGLAVEVEHDRPRRRTLYGHLSELYVKEGDRCARVKSICAWMPLRWRQQGTSHGSRQAPPWAPSTTAISRCWPMCSCPTPDPDGAPPAAGLWMAKQTSSTSAVNPQAPQPLEFALMGRTSDWRGRNGKYWCTMG